MLKDWLVVIPARLHSRRLTRKPLQDLGGKCLIVRVYENLAPLSEAGAEIVVATDSEDVLRACESGGVRAMLTRSDHQSGTDRCAEVAARFEKNYIMNVQGDEPFVDTGDLLSLAKAFKKHENISMATLRCPSEDHQKLFDPNVVKVVGSPDNRALYFSRSPVPFVRDKVSAESFVFYQHLGIYAYTKEGLEKFCSFRQGKLEHLEKLEQLRALENGMDIILVDAKTLSHGIDTPEDLQEARSMIAGSLGGS